MPYTQRRIKVPVRPWLKKGMADRGQLICGVTIHSSRGGPQSSVANDGPATENWMANPANGSAAQGWGGSCDLIIFGDGTQVKVTDWDIEWPSYGAGYGEANSWNLSEYHLQVELAQHVRDVPFDQRTIDSLAEFCAWAARRFNFPLVRLPFLTQREVPIPRGISAHDNCMNGRKLGKSDPGPLFPWDEFLRKTMAYYNGENDMAEVTRAEFDALKKDYETARADFYNNVAWQFNVTDLQQQIEVLRLIQGEQGQRIQKLEDALRAGHFQTVVLE